MDIEVMEYLHGGEVFRISREIDIPINKIIDFSASINPLGPSKRVKMTLRHALNDIVHYPDTNAIDLREEIGQRHNIDPESIICSNGSTELIYLIPEVLRPLRTLIPAPTFSEYERAIIRAQGTEHRAQIRYLFLKEEDNFRIYTDEFINAMQGCDMAFLSNPNNPTGGLLKRQEVLKIADAAREVRCFLVVDEAFIDFIPQESVIRDVRNNPYLIVLRSMTKFYALAGLRVGYGVFYKDLINKIRSAKEPWTVNILAQRAAIAALRDTPYREKTFNLLQGEKKYIEDKLKKMYIRYFPSEANYYLLKIKNAPHIVVNLKNKGILVRHCANFRGLNEEYIRIAVKSHRDNMLLLKELSKLCGA